jgi:predicted peroxiredoxin
MGSISIILRRPPYGSIDSSEAIRHALGGITEDMNVNLILVDGGVNAARKNQDVSLTPFSNIEDSLKDCIDMGVKVYIDKVSMKDEHVDTEDIIEGVIFISSSEVAEIIKESEITMIF